MMISLLKFHLNRSVTNKEIPLLAHKHKDLKNCTHGLHTQVSQGNMCMVWMLGLYPLHYCCCCRLFFKVLHYCSSQPILFLIGVQQHFSISTEF